MRRLLVLAIVVGCGGPRPAAPTTCGCRPPGNFELGPIEGTLIKPPAPLPVETVDGPTSTAGRRPRIPVGPSTQDTDRRALRRIIKQQMAPVAACYERLSPADRRRVVIRFTIGPTGEVLSSKAQGPQGALENCIAAAFAGVQFEPPADGGTVTVTYPLHFRPG